MLRTFRSPLLVLLVCVAGCPECIPTPEVDAGKPDGSHSSLDASRRDASRSDASRVDGSLPDASIPDASIPDAELPDAEGRDAAPWCGPHVPGYGVECGDCAFMLCSQWDQLVCKPLGRNICNGCGPLDTDGGFPGRPCGNCGVVACVDGGTTTECAGDHEFNACGGCKDLPDAAGTPDTPCSQCGTGTWQCQATLNDLVCWGGRASGPHSPGDCNRQVVAYADMEDLTQGAFVRAGTRAILEDVGVDPDLGTTDGRTLILTFDPLVFGPAGPVMEGAIVFLSPEPFHDVTGALAMPEFFSARILGVPGDPLRQYHIPGTLTGMRYVIIFDSYLAKEISRGALQQGAPPVP